MATKFLRLPLQLVCLCLFLLVRPAFAAPDSVNVNSADAATIAAVLDGVGSARAQAIVEYREANGAFGDVYDLTNVKGIGDRLIEMNDGRIRVKD
jgi:competence protein ComEA